MTPRDQLAVIRIPDPDLAPGYQESLGTRSHFSVSEFGAETFGVVPSEGAGMARDYFKLAKLCDSETDLSDLTTWHELLERPPRRRSDVDPREYASEMLQRGEEITRANPTTEAEIVAFALAAFGAAVEGRLPELLETNLPALSERFPAGELFYATVDATFFLLVSRLPAHSWPFS